MKKIFIITGPSASGKNSVLEGVSAALPLVRLITTTTRPPRAGEKEGRDHYFVSAQHFKTLLAKGQLLEWNQFAGHFYGSTKKEFRRVAQKGRSLILELDPKGAGKLKKLWPRKAVVIFLTATESELKRRLIQRGGLSPREIDERLKQWAKDKRLVRQADFVVANPRSRLRSTIRQVKQIINALI